MGQAILSVVALGAALILIAHLLAWLGVAARRSWTSWALAARHARRASRARTLANAARIRVMREQQQAQMEWLRLVRR